MNVLLVFALALLPWVALAGPTDGLPPNASNQVKGDVLYWEGDELIVKEISGNQVRLRVTADTKIEGVAGGRLKSGDKVLATVTPEGHAQRIVLQLPDGGSSISSPGSR